MQSGIRPNEQTNNEVILCSFEQFYLFVRSFELWSGVVCLFDLFMPFLIRKPVRFLVDGICSYCDCEGIVGSSGKSPNIAVSE